MAPPDFQKRSDLEARAAELERRLREVRRAIAAAERGRPVALPPDLQAVRSAPRPPDRPEPAPAAVSGSPAVSRPTAPAESVSPSRAEPAAAVGSRPHHIGADRERFAHYFGSSFLGGPPPSVERRVQRNRAIVMLILVAILAYIVYSLAR